jgi:hypothetical protein
MNLDDRIRKSIDLHTADPGRTDAVPEGLLRRARRRIALTVAVATFAVVSVAGGGFLLVNSLQNDDPHRPAQTPSVQPSPSPGTSAPQSAEELVDRFMRSRLELETLESPHASEFLSEAAARLYDEHANGLWLYSPALEVVWESFEVVSLEPEGDASRAVVEIHELYTGPLGETDRTLTETLTVGPGRDTNGTESDFLVLSAEAQVPTASRVQQVWFLHDFFLARASGRGAEDFLSPTGSAAYEAGTEPLRLYADSETDMTDHLVSTFEPVGDDAYEAVIRLSHVYLGDSPLCPHTEILRVEAGPGGADGWTISDASAPADGWRYGRLDSQAGGQLTCAFVTARVNGAGAEDYLGAAAMEQYEQGEGGLSLYPPDEQSHWGFWWLQEAEETSDGVRVLLTLNNTGMPDAIYEELIIGGAAGDPLVVSARRVPCVEVSSFCP